jgi:hypothetical protein
MNVQPTPRVKRLFFAFVFAVFVLAAFVLTAFVLTPLSFPVSAAEDETPQLTKDQMKQFLRTAEVVKSKQSSKGINHPYRLTLTDGKVTHDASFNSIDEHKSEAKLESGALEFNFVDSWRYNIAGYEVAELVGLGDMVPVYVERKWNGKTGSLSWWLPVMMDDGERRERKLEPPFPDKWNDQIYHVRVFDELIYDTDANLTNILIGHDWTVWRIDFTRAFRRSHDLYRPKDLVKCDKQLLEHLKTLKSEDVLERTKGYLNKDEVNALMARRDKIVARFNELVAQKGANEVLY